MDKHQQILCFIETSSHTDTYTLWSCNKKISAKQNKQKNIFLTKPDININTYIFSIYKPTFT